MKTVNLTPHRAIVLAAIMALLYMGTAFDSRAQSAQARTLIDRLMATENAISSRTLPRAELARTIAKDTSISPKIRVEVLTTILRHELENPCPIDNMADGWYVVPTVYIQKQYVFGLEDIGSRAIPHLRKHLIQVTLAVQNISPSLGNTDNVDVVEMQHIQCALGLLGDKHVLKELIKLLEDKDEDGYMRQMVGGALENIGDKSAIPALKRALNDDFHVDYISGHLPNTIYPVRESASAALRKLGVKIAFEGNSTYRVVR